MAKGTLSPRLFSEQGLSSSPRPASFSSGRAAGAADPPDPPPSAQPWGRGCCWHPGARCPSPGGGIAGTPRHGCGGSGQWGGAGLRAHRCASQNRWWALSPRGRHAALGGPAAVRICLIFSWFPIKQPNIKHIRQRQGGTGPGLSSLQEKENGGRKGAERGAPCRQHEGLRAHCAPSRPLLWGCRSVGSWSIRCSVGLPLHLLFWDPLGSGGREGGEGRQGWSWSRALTTPRHGAVRHSTAPAWLQLRAPAAAPYLPGSGVSAAALAPLAAVYNRAQPHSVGGRGRRAPRPHTWPRSH